MRGVLGKLTLALGLLVLGPMMAILGVVLLARSHLLAFERQRDETTALRTEIERTRRELEATQKRLARALDQARAGAVQSVKSEKEQQTFAIAAQVETALAAQPQLAPEHNPALRRLLRRAGSGRTAAAVLIAPGSAGEQVAAGSDDALMGQPVAHAYPNLARLIEDRGWRQKAGQAAGSAGPLARPGRPAEAGLYGRELWILTALAGSSYWLATRTDLEGAQGEMLRETERPLEGALSALGSAEVALRGVTDQTRQLEGGLSTATLSFSRNMTFSIVGILLLGAVVSVSLLLWMRRSFIEPIRHLTETAERIRAGGYDTRAQVRTGDELEALAGSVNAMVDQIVGLVRSDEDKQRLQRDIVRLLELVSAASSGDMTVRGEVTPDELGSVTDALNHMVESIGGLVMQVRHAGAEVTSAADQILRASKDMADGATLQSQALDAVTIKIKQLGDRSLEINQIVELVDEIAAQTNMLALNAAIEASRAGEQGKGFAVVADEVRKLAERSSSSTKDIGAFIESIQEATSDAIRAME